MIWATPLLAGLVAASAIGGCATNHAKIGHGMQFAQIEDMTQQVFRIGMTHGDVERIANDQLKLELSEIHETGESELVYQLKPKNDGWGYSKHRSYLVFDFDSDRLTRLAYRNYMVTGQMPQGETEIHLVEVTP